MTLTYDVEIPLESLHDILTMDYGIDEDEASRMLYRLDDRSVTLEIDLAKGKVISCDGTALNPSK